MNVAEYSAPQSLDEALAILSRDPAARALAGGNSLLVEPSRTRNPGVKLVDLQRISGLVGVQADGGGLRIGAMVPLATAAGAASAYPALVEAIATIGDAQVRNRATIGGNLAEGDPGVDLPAVLMALGAQVQLQGAGGSRTIGVDELFASGLGTGELIIAVLLPAPAARSGAAYEKFKHPATLYAICGVAASVTLAGDGTISSATVALTGAVERPTRLSGVEAALAGKSPDVATFAAAAGQIGSSLQFRGDHFASAEYRRHLTGVLTQRALTRAAQRARQ
jgi:carbon-monoxide dehydrogenase medium subunit